MPAIKTLVIGPQPMSLRLVIAGVFLLGNAGYSWMVADEPASAIGPVMKLFQSGKLPAERQATVVEMICKRGNATDLRVIFDRILDSKGFDAALRMKAMSWLTDAAVTRKVKPSGDLSPISRLVVGEESQSNDSLRGAAIRLASTWQDGSIAPALRSIALDRAIGPELQRTAIEGLSAIADAESQQTLATLAKPGSALSVRMQAASGLVRLDLELAAPSAAAILVDATAADDTSRLIDAFLNRKSGPEALASALEQRPLTVDVAKRALRYMYSVGRSDAALSDVLSRIAGIEVNPVPPTPAEVAEIVADVTAKGDPTRGEAIFRRKDLSCLKCHSLSRAGGQVGPDLSAVGGTSPVDYVVNSILNPNLAVKEQFVTRVFVSATGQVLTGVVIDRDEVRVNLRDANGRVVTLPTADIDEEYEGKSLMPQGLTKFLTRDELLDLARFVSELGKPGPYAVQQTKTIQRWRVLRSPSDDLTKESPHLDHIRQQVLGSTPEDWDPAYARISGVLPLDELAVAVQDPRVLILQGEFDVTEADRIDLHVACSETYQAWIDAEPLPREPSRRELLHSQTPLAEPPMTFSPAAGRHRLTLRIERSDRPASALRVELKQADNSNANFAVVGGP